MKPIDKDTLAKINMKNQTAWNNAQPKMSVQVMRAKTTVSDSTYWTVETIRTKTGLGDLSIAARRMRAYGSPDKLFNIYVDNGQVKTATRDYPDYEQNKWQDQLNVGAGSAAAIAFDGYWGMHRKKWQMITHELPWIFWVSSGKLQGQIWDDSSSRMDLADNVSKVKAIRGWRNVNIYEIDQGLIVGYIKTDGKVYYRNFAYQEDGSPIWGSEKQISAFTGTAVNLNLFITNDYRVGFAIEDSASSIHLFVTERAWAGMAIFPDKFIVGASASVDFLPVNYYHAYEREKFVVTPVALGALLYAMPYNNFRSIENVDNGEGDHGRKVVFTTGYKILNLNNFDFALEDSMGRMFNCTNIVAAGGGQYCWRYEAEFNNFNNAAGETKLIFNGQYGLNEAGTALDSFEGSFTPLNLLPVDVPAPLVVGAHNEDDQTIVIEFDRPLFGGVVESLDAFEVSSIYWKDTFEDVELTETHEIAAVEERSHTEIALTLVYPSGRLKRANVVTVNYDTDLGFLVGETARVESFSEAFAPDIDKLLDPAARELFTVDPVAAVDLIKVEYSTRYGHEAFVVTANCVLNFEYVGIINP